MKRLSKDQKTASVILLSALALLLSVGLFTNNASSEVRRRPSLAPVPEEVPPNPENRTECQYQEPQEFLVRSNFMIKGRMPREERQRRMKLHEKTVEYRTKQYGYFEGFGRRDWNERSPAHNSKVTEFMGLRVRLNKRILPVLPCVEQQIREECADTPYEPRRLSGLRDRNTYHNHEVSNHVYGIAIDVDPTLNTCCGCVAQWADHPLCKRDVDSIYDRMAMPECWVHVFERFGFHWLGRDPLQDTMHFEFLGDPDYILKTAGTPPHMRGSADAGVDGGDAAPNTDGGPSSDASAPTAPAGDSDASAAGDSSPTTNDTGPSDSEDQEPTSSQHWSGPSEGDERGGCQACAAIPGALTSFDLVTLLLLG